MKAGIIITGSGSILILTSLESLENLDLVSALNKKGINKYIAFEVPEDLVKNQYGQHYSITLADRTQKDVIRVVDVDGQRIFRNFDLTSLGTPIFHDEEIPMKKAA